MTKGIKKMISTCTTCQRFQAKQHILQLERQPTPDCPWQILASDLLDFDGAQYVVITDMYSKMSFVRKMPTSGATAAAVISKMKELFAEHEYLMSLEVTMDLSMQVQPLQSLLQSGDFNTRHQVLTTQH